MVRAKASAVSHLGDDPLSRPRALSPARYRSPRSTHENPRRRRRRRRPRPRRRRSRSRRDSSVQPPTPLCTTACDRSRSRPRSRDAYPPTDTVSLPRDVPTSLSLSLPRKIGKCGNRDKRERGNTVLCGATTVPLWKKETKEGRKERKGRKEGKKREGKERRTHASATGELTSTR